MVCRLCFSSIDECIEIFSEEKIPKYIKKFLDLEIIPDDPVSKLICNTCLQELNSFQNFYMRIKEAQRRPLMTLKKEPLPTEIEFEPMDNSTFDYVSAELETDQDHGLSESTEVTQNESKEQTVTDSNEQKTCESIHPSFTLKKVRHYRKMTKSTRSFKNETERKRFVDLMEKEEVIWNRTHSLHSSPSALTDAWKRIAVAMSPPKSVHECKTMWKSLRDALRYERRKVASGFDQGNGLRNLLYFITSANYQNQKKSKPIKNSLKKPESKNKILHNSIEDQERYKIQNYHAFESTNPAWSERTAEGSQSDNMSAYSERTAKHFSNNVALETVKTNPHSTVGVFTIESVKSCNNTENIRDPPPASNIYYGNFKKEFKDEVSDLVESISKSLNRLVTLATNQSLVESQNHQFKYEYIWKLIECLYGQMEQTTINDLNQKIINMVYEGCKVNAY